VCRKVLIRKDFWRYNDLTLAVERVRRHCPGSVVPGEGPGSWHLGAAFRGVIRAGVGAVCVQAGPQSHPDASGGGQVAEVGIISKGEDAGGPAVAGDDGEGAVEQGQFAGAPDAQAEQDGQVDADGDVVRNHQQSLAGVGVEEPFQDGGDAVVDLLQGLAAGVGAVGRVGQEGGVGRSVVLAHLVPGEPLPAAQVALGQRLQGLRCQSRDDGRCFRCTAERATATVAEGDAGKTVSYGLGLENPEGSEGRITALSLQSGWTEAVSLRRSMAQQVEQDWPPLPIPIQPRGNSKPSWR
jgi:hypothetical protein